MTTNPSPLPEDDRAPPMPLWVKVFGIAFLVLVLAFVIMALSGHGPSSHMPMS